MNVKISKEIATVLDSYTFDTVEFGNTEGEDRDLIHFVQHNYEMDCSFIQNNHPLFYKDEVNKVDHIYITTRQFVRGIIFGENVLFHEILEQGLLDNVQGLFDIVSELKGNCTTYKILKSYIGCAMRDLKQADKMKDNNPKKVKKLYWVENYARIICELLQVPYLGCHKEALSDYRHIINEEYEEGCINFTVSTDIILAVDKSLKNDVDLFDAAVLHLPEIVEAYHNAWIGEN